MDDQHGLERCLTFINCQLQPSTQPLPVPPEGPRWRAVTISRQCGSGAHSVAEKLLELLQAQSPEDACPWTIFDRNLVEKVLEDHKLPSRLARFMPEDRVSEISDTLDELFGLHPPSWTLVHETADTILHLAQLGNVILIGRGASVITAKLNYVFHVRLVGPLEKRIQHIAQAQHLSARDAAELVHREDLGRSRYLKKYFDKDINDPLLYHLTINTDLVSYGEAARMVAEVVVPQKVSA